jgi:hypothetical protein
MAPDATPEINHHGISFIFLAVLLHTIDPNSNAVGEPLCGLPNLAAEPACPALGRDRGR